MRKKWIPLVGSLTVAGTVAFSVGISVTLKTPKEISKPPEQVALQSTSVPTKQAEKAKSTPNISGNGINVGSNDGQIIGTLNGNNTQYKTQNDNRYQQHTKCSSVNNGSACTNNGTMNNQFNNK